MQLKLVSFVLCPYVHRATIALLEKGIDFELTYIELSAKPAWFLEISPLGRVPVLVADGRPIFESMVIVEFLDETHGPRLLPDDPFERARVRSWCEVASPLFQGLYRLTHARSADELAAARTAITDGLDRFEAELAGPFFAGERFGLVDVAAGPALHRLVLLEEDTAERFFEGRPKVAAWARTVAARPSVRDGVVPDFPARFVESLRGSVLAVRDAGA